MTQQRHTRTPAKMALSKQLERVRNQLQLLHASHKITLSTVTETPDEEAAQQAVIASNSKLINMYSEEAERLRLTIKHWDKRQHSQTPTETTSQEDVSDLESAQSKMASLDNSINSRRAKLVELSEEQRQLKSERLGKSVEELAVIQSRVAKNSRVLSTLQSTISKLRESYDRVNDLVFSLQQ
tara:strand:+ start:15413 stop:15961 length:549 start_codon:yes stop_codon:yes gene_type:complete